MDWVCFGPIKYGTVVSIILDVLINNKNIFGVVVVVGGGDSDVKVGCTIYWRIFPVKVKRSRRGANISVVNSILLISVF